MKIKCIRFLLLLTISSNCVFSKENISYVIVDTGQNSYFDSFKYISKPKKNDVYFGQDASYIGNKPSYTNNSDGTISDKNSGLMWQKAISKKLTWNEAVEYANESKLAGYDDWRIPTIKELYSLINFSGVTGTSRNKGTTVPSNAKPYIDTKYFDFEYSSDKRYIDAQYWTQTSYVSTTMKGAKTFFGVNFADGRIKGYPKFNKGRFGSTEFYLRLVRGNANYGKNDFVDNKDGTIYDNATNLTWMQYDSADKVFNSNKIKGALNWKHALSFCENLTYAKIDTWRLPNAKELQSIVDYTRSPDTTQSAAINEIFNSTAIKNKNGQIDYPFYWTSTTHLDGHQMGNSAVYIAFGRALGYMRDRRTNEKELMDVHGAGAQRSDPKSGDASRYQYGRGPQGDVISIDNYVRCVRDDNTIINKSNDYKVNKTHNNNRTPPRPENDVSENDNRKNENFQRPPKGEGGNSNKLLKRFDKNHDNKISYDEAPKKMKENFNRHDTNSNGFLDKNELNTLPPPR